jgi:mono/diheme cytochrome c family protein
MNRAAGLFATALAACFWSTAAAAQGPAPAPFSQDQVDAGRESFALNCADCHNKDLSGGNGPPLVGKPFLSHWAGHAAQDLYQYIRTTMPVCSGGLLGDRNYLEITAYLLWANGADPGKDDLAADSKANISDFTSGAPRAGLPGK